MRPTPALLAAAGLLVAGAGCETSYPSLTCGLWTGNTLRSFNEPAADPRLEVFVAAQPGDFLVTYDESSERNDAIRRRAFFLQANLDRLNAGRKPRFVRLARTNGLAPLTAGAGPSAGPAPSRPGPAPRVELTAGDGRAFAVIDAAGGRLASELPTYPAAGGEVLRVLITPLAVAGDTVIAASVVGLIVAVASARSGVTYSP